ncbi:MAG: DNA alkylation repair protein [Candidatus Bathyarchaeota archaeon]|nr:DNA alkylation repair protein [Candidatus Bathyarchaeota archaeon]
MPITEDVKKELKKLENKKLKELLQGYFKTGKGEYGEGDIFLGIKIGPQREIAGRYKDLSLKDIEGLLDSRIHEYRLTALLILINKYNKIDENGKKKVFETYMKKRDRINNWDLVDLSAPKIVGSFLVDKDRKILYDLAKSENVWDRRISIISTFAFIRSYDFKDAVSLAEVLLKDEHDLIHKAVGWVLREIGKKDLNIEEEFLKKHYKEMPRTMLRYSIERFDNKKKKFYMQK